MSIHALLEDQMQALEAIGDLETKRKQLEQLPALTQTLERTYQQALYLSLVIELMSQVFEQKPVCASTDFQAYLQQPLKHISAPDQVFAKNQAELTAFQTQLVDSREHLQTLTKEMDQQLADFKRTLTQEIDTVRGLLKIPELLPQNMKASQVEQILQEVNKVIQEAQATLNLSARLKVNSTKNFQQLARNWASLYPTFLAIRQQLSFDRLRQSPYNLSDPTITLIKELVSGKTLTLDKLTPAVMEDLHRNFKQFLSQIVLRFTAQN